MKNKLLFSIFFIGIVGFVFLFNSGNLVFAKGCDWGCVEKPESCCGDWAGCEDTQTQSTCYIECDYGYEWPYCDCKNEPEVSKCWCECENGCANQWCKNLGYASGKCKSKTEAPQCCDATETSCQDGKDNDCDGDIDCADITDCPAGTSCGSNKICKNKKCVAEGPPVCASTHTHCEYKVSANCLCGAKEIDAGKYCCASLSKGYTIQGPVSQKGTCLYECKSFCPSNCEEITEDCLCNSTLIKAGEGYCYDGKKYDDIDECKEDKDEDDVPEDDVPVVGITFENPLIYDEFSDLIDGIIKFIFNIAIVLVPLAIVIGAFFLLISGGDPEKIKTGKTIILYSLIGLIIVLLAKGLISMIESILSVEIGG